MRKRTIVCFICGIVVMIMIASIVFISTRSSRRESGVFYVNDRKISDINVAIYKDHAEIPFVEMLKELGIDVIWTTNSTAEFICRNEKYILDLAEVSLVREGTANNLFIPTPGCTVFVCKEKNHDIILDDGTAASVIFFLQNDVLIQIDYKELAVYVAEK